MRIGFDIRCLEERNISGVGEYTLELFKNMIDLDTKNTYVVFSNSFRGTASQNFGWLKKYPNVEIKRFSFPNKIFNFFLWYFSFPKIDRLIGGVDVFFAPNINFLAISTECPLLVTFHDLSFERFPGYFDFTTRIWHQYFVQPRKIARAASGIIAVSDSTKKDLEEIYRVDPRKIGAVHHGVSEDFKEIDNDNPKLPEVQKKYHLPEKFILFLGNIESRKNIFSTAAAFDSLINKNKNISNYKLVLVGNLNKNFRKIIKNKNIIWCGYIDRKDRPYLYNLAKLLVYPSFFEGFGLPVLEATACGTPVVTSNNSSLPEVAGAAAILIDPNRPTELAKAMRNVILDNLLYDKMRKRGLAQAKKFGWGKCAKETLEIIESL
jgi:glycosyltransferase involved in cell wall biosynthesis